MPALPGFWLQSTDSLLGSSWIAAPAGNPALLPVDREARFFRMNYPSRGDLAGERLRESLRFSESPALSGEDLRREQALALFRLAWLTDDVAKAYPLHERSLLIYRQIGDLSQVASGLAALGYLWKSSGKLEQAETCFAEGLQLRRTLKTPGIAAEVSFHLGELRSRHGRFKECLRVFREGLRLARRANDPTREIRGLA